MKTFIPKLDICHLAKKKRYIYIFSTYQQMIAGSKAQHYYSRVTFARRIVTS